METRRDEGCSRCYTNSAGPVPGMTDFFSPLLETEIGGPRAEVLKPAMAAETQESLNTEASRRRRTKNIQPFCLTWKSTQKFSNNENIWDKQPFQAGASNTERSIKLLIKSLIYFLPHHSADYMYVTSGELEQFRHRTSTLQSVYYSVRKSITAQQPALAYCLLGKGASMGVDPNLYKTSGKKLNVKHKLYFLTDKTRVMHRIMIPPITTLQNISLSINLSKQV